MPQKPKRTYRLRSVSRKRAEQLKIYAHLKKTWHRCRPICEVKVEDGICGKKAMKSPHHLMGREGKYLNMIEHWLPICFWHHNFIHSNPAWAYLNGYLLKRIPK